MAWFVGSWIWKKMNAHENLVSRREKKHWVTRLRKPVPRITAGRIKCPFLTETSSLRLIISESYVHRLGFRLMFPKFVFILTILLQGNCLLLKVIVSLVKSSGPVVHKVCSADPRRFATGSQRIRGYMSVMATFKFTYFLIKVITFC